MKREGHNGIPQASGDESVTAIEEEIRRNRADMDHTLEELGRRLEPRRLADDLWGTVRERIPKGSEAANVAQDIGASVARRIGAHPVPSALIGVGLLWLLAEETMGESVHMKDIGRGVREGARRAGEGMRRAGEAAVDKARSMRGGSEWGTESDYGYTDGGSTTSSMRDVGERASERISHAGERVKGAAARAGDRMSHAGERVRGAASRAGDRMMGAAARAGDNVWDAAHRAGDTAARTYDQHPIAVGLAALGVGLLAGVAVPNTRRENEAIGPSVDRMKRRAMEAAEHKVDDVKHKVEDVMHKAEQKVDEAGSKAEGAIAGERKGEEERKKEPLASTGGQASANRAPPSIPPSPPNVP